MTQTDRVLTVLALVLAGLSAGAFFAFSTFVMPALRAVPTRVAVHAMQAINRAAPNALFVGALFAPLLLGGWLCVSLRGQPGHGWAIAATACVLAGLVVLVAYHVPRNDALGRVPLDATDLAARWRAYHPGWTAWNHVRTLAFTAATALFALSLGTA